jgi:hypothetical protein
LKQRGQGLALVLIILAFGSVVLTALMAQVSSSLSASRASLGFLLTRHAAEGGIDEVLRDLLEGKDALSPGYTIPAPNINGYDISITITSPTAGAAPAGIYQYIDPGASYGLASLASLADYYFRIDNVRPGSSIRVNWAFTPAGRPWTLTLYAGTGPAIVAKAQASMGPGALLVDGTLVSGGMYTVEFSNNSGVSLASSGYSPSGGVDSTWVYTQAYKDYIISSSAGNATISVYARQNPGPTEPVTGQKVYSEAWAEP